MSFSTCFAPLSTRFWPLSTRLSISWPGVADRRDDQWNWLPECEQGPCRPRCMPNWRKSNQGVAVGGRKWFLDWPLSTCFWPLSTRWLYWPFLKGFLRTIQGQYKVARVDAKETVWAAEAHAIFTFSAMGWSKTS